MKLATALLALSIMAIPPAYAGTVELYSVNPISGLKDYSRPIQRYDVQRYGNTTRVTPLNIYNVPDYSRRYEIYDSSANINDYYNYGDDYDDLD
jgi:hypothetical protein